MKSFINIVFFWIVFLSIESNAQIPQANNLISYYPFSGGIDDQSGKNHNTGTIYGNPSLTQNRFGVANAAYNLDGIDDYLYFGNSIYADLSQVNGYYQGSFTISIWAKSAVSDEENFISFGESDGYYTAMISYIGNSISFNSANWGSGANISGKKSDNTWHQYTFVYSAGSFRKIFIDGVSVTQNNDSRLRFNFKNYGLSVGIGRFSSTGIPEGLTTTYTGSVDDVRVWNVALSDSEVASLYAFDNNVANDFPAILVTNLADNGTSGTLRWAIDQANSNADASVINFDAALTGTITLTSNLPNITANLNITGSGKQKITISGNNLYKMFVANGGPTFSISSLTLTKGSSGSPTAGSIISASGSTVTANDILVTANTGNFLFSTAGDGSYLTITNSEFSTNSSYVLFGSDYGSTPTTTAPDADYTNRITVIRSKFVNNSNILFSTQRYVKIDLCEFTGNSGGIGSFGGVNRLQVLNSKFTSNGSTLFQYSSWLTESITNSWVQTLGNNNFLFDNNIFENNTGTVIYTGHINNGLKTTITNNTFINNGTNWTGTPIAVSTNYLDNFISAIQHDINNSTIIVTMSKPVFGGLNSTGNVDINDFQLQLSGGNATLASAIPSSIAINGNTITLGIQLNGLTSGAELLKVVPIANSIYDAGNNIAGTLQKNNSINLKFLDADSDGVSDLLDQCPNTPNSYFVNASGCPDPTAGMLWNGPGITFSMPPNSNHTLRINQDSITTGIILTRPITGYSSLINISSESTYTSAISPVGTRWARVNSTSLTKTQIKQLTFSTWNSITIGRPGRFSINQLFLVYLPDKKIYFYLKLLSWNELDGSFSYERSTNPAPTAISLSAKSINENSATGTVLANLSSTDSNPNDTHTYSLVAGSGDTNNASFEIVGNQLKIKESFDFETKSSYSVRIRTTDATSLSFENTFTITITDVNETPSALALSANSINENSAIGTVLANLSSTDVDANDTYTYTLVTGTGSTNNSSFEVVGNQLKIKELFDFESKSSYSVRIRSTDAGSLNFENTFAISINDVNETPSAIALSANSINENSAIGAVLANLSSTDVDANDTHTYTLVAGSGDTNNSSFEIVGNQLKIKELFDFESKSSYVVRIRSTDAGSLSFENTFTITITDVNETPSAMAITKSNLYESNTINQVVGLLSTTDQDASDSHTYSLVSGLGSTDNTAFNVSGNQIRASQVFSSATKNSYSIRVRTTDKGGLSFEKVYTVSISQLPTLTGTGNEVGTKLQAVASTNPIISKGFTSKLNVSGIDTASYNWSPSASLSSTSIYNPVAKPSQTQSYSVTVTNNYGSSTTLSITVEVMEDWNLLANNILTPNGDGVNDKWEIENLSSYPNNQLIIMDRSSRVLYRKTVYANEWNGLFNGIPLPSDTYYYVLTFDSPSGQKVSKKGFITITQ
jgi:gliding motility-associated-like protein